MTKDEQKLASLEAQKIKEQAFKLVVKIISWQSGSLDSVVVKSANKITSVEWEEYKKRHQNIFPIQDLQKVKEALAKTYDLIKSHGGFE